MLSGSACCIALTMLRTEDAAGLAELQQHWLMIGRLGLLVDTHRLDSRHRSADTKTKSQCCSGSSGGSFS